MFSQKKITKGGIVIKVAKVRRKKSRSSDSHRMTLIFLKSCLNYLARLDLEGGSIIWRGYEGLKWVVSIEL